MKPNSQPLIPLLAVSVFAAVVFSLTVGSGFAQPRLEVQPPPVSPAFSRLEEWAAGRWDVADRVAAVSLPLRSAGLQSPDSGRPQQVARQAPLLSSISGYMDFHVNNVEGRDASLDFHRFVLLFAHSFSERVRFVSELELEHAFVEGLEEAGELELEQAYIDFLVSRQLNLRAGMLLVPVGIINERHEPPVYHGVERPFVDTIIVPSTWFEGGAGVHGEIGRGVRYRAYVMAPLDSSGFTADEGLRGGRQKGSESSVRNVATTGRVEYVGIGGLWAGASFWRGKTGFNFPRVETQVTLGEADARYRIGELEARAQYVHAWLTGMDELNRTLQRTVGVNPNVASEIRGFYLEGSYFILPKPAPREAAVFVRYENFDTQYRMPTGFNPIGQFDRDAWVFGLSYYPDPDVVLKIDYSVVRNQSLVINEPNSFNVGLGWWF